MPETNQDGAHAAAERVRRAIAARPFEVVGTLTISAGVCADQNGQTVEELLSFADQALYCAKNSGRNTTISYTDDARQTLRRAT